MTDTNGMKSAEKVSDNVAIELLKKDVLYLARQIIEMRDELHAQMEKRVLYVEFKPVQLIAFGLVMMAATAVFAALITIAMKGGV